MATVILQTDTRIVYQAAPGGDQSFPVTFAFPEPRDLAVFVASAVTTAWSYAGGAVVLPAPVANVTVEIELRVVLERRALFPTSGQFDTDVLNHEVDVIYAALRQQGFNLDQLGAAGVPSFTGAASLSDPLEAMIRNVCLVPATGPFTYGTTLAERVDGASRVKVNGWHDGATADFVHSAQQMRAAFPSLRHVTFVYAWFGDDLRLGHCTITPRVEFAGQVFEPQPWTVGAFDKDTAPVVSKVGPDPAYGATPSDISVLEALAWFRQQGIGVTFYPFILMDVPAGNTLPNREGGTGQPVYPWRGRMFSPNDGSAAARTDIDTFFDRAEGFRAFVLHCANLCVQAGGVDAFCVGTEMVGMTQTRDGANAFPAVERLVGLVNEVRATGCATHIGYAADWTEYHSFRLGGDVFFNMDPLWLICDFVGIDNYMPMSDWRDGEGHADFKAGWFGPTDEAYLRWGVERGELVDWFYASEQDRADQVRTPIVDTWLGQHWIYGQKNLRGWWSSEHRSRIDGVLQPPSPWVPMGKPVWMTEFGAPAVDRAGNQPNVFIDPKSSESFFPYYSRGFRDDFAQRQVLRAFIGHWTADTTFSPVYAGRMVDPDRISVWTWDARPWPTFPLRQDVWSDGENYAYGHWLNGRFPTRLVAGGHRRTEG